MSDAEAPPNDSVPPHAPAPEIPDPSESCPRCAFLIAAGRRTQNGGHSITPERQRVFLETLAETDFPTAASAQASPWAKGYGKGVSSSCDLKARDPEFATA